MARQAKFEECRRCVNWKFSSNANAVCRSCGNGEHFEEAARELDLTEDRMVERMMARLNRDEE